MNKCSGCGVVLQSDDKDKLGYTRNLNNSLCERCFRIRNYSDYKLVSKDNNDYIEILKNIGATNSLVILVVDLFNIPKTLEEINKYINNKILLVLSKRDILPLSVYDVNLINYFKRYKLNICDTITISSNKNINFDELLEKINEHKTDDKVYVVGFTNAGKSTMINKLLYNYTNSDICITTSMLPSTTIDSIEININEDLTLIDTPGLLDSNNLIDVIDISTMKKVVPKKEIKPKTYQIKASQSLFVEDLLRLDIKDNNSLTFYISNDLNIDRVFKETDKLINLKRHDLKVNSNNDIVITGLGFIKCTMSAEITIYTLDKVDVYVRESLI